MRLLRVIEVEAFVEAGRGQGARRPARVLGLDGVTNSQNVGMVVRSVVGAGLDGLLWPVAGQPWVNGLVVRAAAGALFECPIVRCETLVEGLAGLQGAGFEVFGLAGERAQSLAVAFLVSTVAAPALGATYVVDGAGGADFTTIQEAVDVAQSGDSVLVEPGLYPDPIEIVSTDLILISRDGPGTTILDGQGAHRVLSIEDVRAPAAVIGFTIRNGWSGEEEWRAAGLHARNSEIRIEANGFEHNANAHAPFGALGAALRVSGSAAIVGNVFRENEAVPGEYDGRGSAIAVQESPGIPTGFLIEGNLAHANVGDAITVLYCGPDANVVLRRNTLVANVGTALAIDEASGFLLEHTIFFGNGNDLNCRDAGPARAGGDRQTEIRCVSFDPDDVGQLDCPDLDVVEDVVAVDPLFCDPGEHDYRLSPDSPVAEGATACGRIGALETGCEVVSVSTAPAVPPVDLLVAPNPAHRVARFTIVGPATGLEVFDVEGRRVADVSVREGHASWDLTDSRGERVPAGVYFGRTAGPLSGSAVAIRVLSP